MSVVFWTYEASEHCNDCALKRFGRDALDNDETTDSEDNPLRPVFDTDEVLNPPYCGTCRNPIDYDMGPLHVAYRTDVEDGDVVAIIEDRERRTSDFTGYVHVGQHTAVSRRYVDTMTRQATESEYAELHAEIEGIYSTFSLTIVDSISW